MLSRIRQELKLLKPYVSAVSLSGGVQVAIRLDANENPWPPFGPMGDLCPTNRYIAAEEAQLYSRVASVLGMPEDQISIGRGSSESIDLLIRLFCHEGQDEILICPPTFSMYEVYAKIQGAKVLSVPLREDGQLDMDGIKKACTENTKLIFIPTPNAPMGHVMNRGDIMDLCQHFDGKTAIIADEAYVEFTDDPRGLIDEIKNYPNLIVMRTLSKAFALAGERIGMAISNPDIIGMLRRISAPYNLTQSSAKAAMDALSPVGLALYEERRRTLMAEREKLLALLPTSPLVVKVFPSVTNFLLVQAHDVQALIAALARYDIRGRVNVCAIPNTLRISLGTPEENDILLRAVGANVPVTSRAPRLASLSRETKETQINVTINLDVVSSAKVETGIGFFDHMLAQIATHGGFGLTLTCVGDLAVDPHHTIEDVALALGASLRQALGDKKGIARYGFTTPLDEALASVALDLSGRPFLQFDGTVPSAMAGEMPSDMVAHFMRSFATALGASLHVGVRGENTHHMIEACFKALGRALRQAIQRDGETLPSTKGAL